VRRRCQTLNSITAVVIKVPWRRVGGWPAGHGGDHLGLIKNISFAQINTCGHYQGPHRVPGDARLISLFRRRV
jgi:hypothetical protein